MGANIKEQSTSKVFTGLDVLKFLMALMIVAIHVGPFEDIPILKQLLQPLISAAVPVFFSVSAFLLFRKLGTGGGKKDTEILLHYVKRIGILYLVWFCIESPYVFITNGYFVEMGVGDSLLSLGKRLFFGSTFLGSWFLSSLIISVVIVYLSFKMFGKYVTFVFSLLISLYLLYHNILPDSVKVVYKWYAANLRNEVDLSFPFALVWVSMGQCMAESLKNNNIEKYKSWCWGLLVVFYVLFVTTSLKFLLYPFVVLLLLVAIMYQKASLPIYRYLRNVSILMYLSHFAIAGKYHVFVDMIGCDTPAGHIIYYLIVLVISMIFATIVLVLEKYHYLRFLKYTH